MTARDNGWKKVKSGYWARIAALFHLAIYVRLAQSGKPTFALCYIHRNELGGLQAVPSIQGYGEYVNVSLNAIKYELYARVWVRRFRCRGGREFYFLLDQQIYNRCKSVINSLMGIDD